jgi:hypothetical protein
MQQFTPLGHFEVHTEIAGHSYTFRRLNWREEIVQTEIMRLAPKKGDPRRGFLAHMLSHIDGKPLTLASAIKVMNALRAPVLERVYMIAVGGLPPHRTFSVGPLYKAPGVKMFARKIVEEDETEAEAGDKFLEGIFGKDEVDEEREMEAAIFKASGKKGAVKLNPFTQEPVDGEE